LRIRWLLPLTSFPWWVNWTSKLSWKTFFWLRCISMLNEHKCYQIFHNITQFWLLSYELFSLDIFRDCWKIK
jgi:hypothetical protein